MSSIEPPPSPPPAEAQEPERLYHAKESYNEVLDATKHQDDKIGRFLTGIAFLIAGSLVFTSPEVLQARYAVGSTHLRLPAIALITFLVLVVFSVLLYVLAMAAPLTTPSPPAARRSRHRSHLFFLLIARETQESWDQLWKNTTVEELQRDLLVEYLSETRNIAQRADEKYERSNEASAVFVVALLFFLLGTVFSVDVLQHAKPPTGATLQVPTELNWSAPLRATVAIILALFAAVLVYFRLRAAQTRRLGELTRPERKWSDGWSALHVLLLMYPVFVLIVLVPGPGRGALGEIVAVLAGLAAVAVGVGWYLLVVGKPKERIQRAATSLGRKVIARSILAICVGVGITAWFAAHHGWPVWQLGLALGAAITPLAPNAWESSRKLHERVQWHLRLAGSAAGAPDGPGQPGGNGGPA